MRLRSMFVVASVLLLPLSACTDSATPPVEVTYASIPEALSAADGMSKTAAALDRTGIADIFAGQASYTLLAPNDGAFAGLEGADDLFENEEGTPVLAALLRLHIMPGYLSPTDISAAIKAAPDGKVTVRAMDGSDLVFTSVGDQLLVTGPDGVSANLTGDPISIGSSAAITVDAILRKP